MNEIGKLIIIIGVGLIVVGIIMLSNARIPFLGKLPGDIFIVRKNFSFYFPLTTGIIVSIVLSLIFRFFFRK